MFLGSILIIIGIVFLLRNLGYISEPAWSIIWPVILIIIGVWILLKKEERFYWKEYFGWRKKTTTRPPPEGPKRKFGRVVGGSESRKRAPIKKKNKTKVEF